MFGHINFIFFFNAIFKATIEVKKISFTLENIFGMVLAAKLCLILLQLHGYSPRGSSVHRISQARTLEWVAISFSKGFPHLGIELTSLRFPALAGRSFTTSAIWETTENVKPLEIKSLK